MNNKEITVSAPGKIHFLGEHVVVHGNPALITAVDKRCVVSLIPTEGSNIKISSANLSDSVDLSADEIRKKRDEAQRQWEEYRKSGDMAILKSITAQEMDFPIIAIGEALHYFKKDVPSGFSLSIESDIPMGAGLGSSAATAVSVVAAMTSFLGEDFNRATINDIAFLVEQKRHGMPSGGDNAAVCFGGLVWFRKETPDVKIIQPIQFSVSDEIAQNFLIIDTGRPKESTGEMVGMVNNLYQSNQDLVEKVLRDQEKLTRDLLAVLRDGDEARLIEIIKLGEHNLETLGVVSPSSKKLIREVEESGGAAKICGAGGNTEASGVVLAYHKDKKVLQDIASGRQLQYYQAALGAEGLREE